MPSYEAVKRWVGEQSTRHGDAARFFCGEHQALHRADEVSPGCRRLLCDPAPAKPAVKPKE